MEAEPGVLPRLPVLVRGRSRGRGEGPDHCGAPGGAVVAPHVEPGDRAPIAALARHPAVRSHEQPRRRSGQRVRGLARPGAGRAAVRGSLERAVDRARRRPARRPPAARARAVFGGGPLHRVRLPRELARARQRRSRLGGDSRAALGDFERARRARGGAVRRRGLVLESGQEHGRPEGPAQRGPRSQRLAHEKHSLRDLLGRRYPRPGRRGGRLRPAGRWRARGSEGGGAMTRAMRLCLWWAAIALFPAAGAAQSPDTNIVSDGTLGTVVTKTSPTSLAIAGGTAAGTNLFHSFGEFNLGQGDSAVYQVGSAVANVISRVTGGHPSLISGAVSAQISGTGETSGANFFFLNPHGVVFNQNQNVDTNGAFFVTSAQELRFADGTVFGAGTPASALTMAAPESFGFLGGARGRVGPESIDFVGQVISLANETVETNRPIRLAGRAISLSDTHLLSHEGIWIDSRSLEIDRSTLQIFERYSNPPPDPDPEHDPRLHIAAHRWIRLRDSMLISPYSIDLTGGALSMTDSGIEGDGGVWIEGASIDIYWSGWGVI